jgi:hypothetical protein
MTQMDFATCGVLTRRAPEHGDETAFSLSRGRVRRFGESRLTRHANAVGALGLNWQSVRHQSPTATERHQSWSRFSWFTDNRRRLLMVIGSLSETSARSKGRKQRFVLPNAHRTVLSLMVPRCIAL